MRAKVAVLAVCMLLTGSLNTIATKLQDNVVVRFDAAGQPIRFRHPAFQTAAMFLGESLCLVPFALRRWWRAAKRAGQQSEEEAAARTLLNLGLFYTYASVFQMLRGTLAAFAGLLTIVLLHRRLHSHHWLGMVLICAGAALVGASSIIYDRADPRRTQQPAPQALGGLAAAMAGAGGQAGRADGGHSGSGPAAAVRRLLIVEGLGGTVSADTAPNPLLGNVLVVTAQLLAATQFIVEEKYLVKYRAPVLMAVGMEGFWGLVLSCVALPVLQYVRGSRRPAAGQHQRRAGGSAGERNTAVDHCRDHHLHRLFNFFGVSVTKNLSGAARATIDACRTLFIWLFALRMGWERFHMLQVIGFLVLLSGTSVYNEILRSCLPTAEPRRHPPRSPPPADVPASRPIAAGRHGDARYTMARSVTILPAALSPHSLASVPSASFGDASFTFSVPRNLSSGSGLGAAHAGLGGEEDEAATAAAFGSESEVSESEADSREPSQHGPAQPGGWLPARPPPRGQ
ncbi:hypothetical protein ABPG77_003579 [Micractinium sp. CCAP 211/92]